MTDKEFDERVRRMCSEVTPLQIPDVWDAIEKKLARRRRIILWRRAGMVSAAAAVIAAGFILSYGHDVAVPAGTVTVSETQQLVSQSVAERFSDRETVSPRQTEDTASRHETVLRSVSDTFTGENESSAVSVQEVATSPVPHVPAAEQESSAQPEQPGPVVAAEEKTEGYGADDYVAFADDRNVSGERIAMTVSSDFYTIYGSGNVNFTGRSMSGGTSGTGFPAVKPLSDDMPVHDLPLTAGLGVQYGFGKANACGQHRFGVGLGLNYTLMRSSYQALVSKEFLGRYGQGSVQASVSQTVHYLGIPFTFFVNILTTDRVFFYASAGGAVEKGLRLKYKFTEISGEVSNVSEPVSGLQWSADLGLGFEYRFVRFMGVYVDPRLTYFFDCSQPYSIREEQPLQLTLGVGFRFHF